MESDESGTRVDDRAPLGRRAKEGPAPLVVRVVDVSDVEVADPAAVLAAARTSGWAGQDADLAAALGWLMAKRPTPPSTACLAHTGHARALDYASDVLADQAGELRSWLAAGTHEEHPAAS